MKKVVLKLDDIGREAHSVIFNTMAWALANKCPLSIGTIGADLAAMPSEVVDIIKLGVRLGFAEIWNHGHRHLRYDVISTAEAEADVTNGHSAIYKTFGIESAGFGFPYNRYTKESLSVVKGLYPNYLVFETDFSEFRLLSPEYNALADGQPRFSYFRDRLAQGGRIASNIVMQAHPPRWTGGGFKAFTDCVLHLTEKEGFVCLSASDAIAFGAAARSNPQGKPGKIVAGKRTLVDSWESSADEYVKSLSNFKSYFLPRFSSDVEKNYIQTSRALYPFKPRSILDLGCGLGNWSLPFWLAGDCQRLILNDVNQTIAHSLRKGLPNIKGAEHIVVDERNLLATPDCDYKVELLVSANTFNYVDPIDFFRFAQSCVVPGGRMLLMQQTEAFNKLRYRTASEAKNRSIGAEVLSSDFSMLLRRHAGVFTSDVRHVFQADEITKLAVMFDFSAQGQFTPAGELLEEEKSVYECLVFKKTTGMRDAILARDEWLADCAEAMQRSFGSRAFKEAGFPDAAESMYCGYDREWTYPATLKEGEREFLQEIKAAIYAIKHGSDRFVFGKRCALSEHPDFQALVERIRVFSDLVRGAV